MTNDEYMDFVYDVMSDGSKDHAKFVKRIEELPFNVPMLLTAVIGLSGESGEVSDLVKKILFHGKPFTPELREKLELEFSDCFWYLAAACIALGTSFDIVMEKNVDKLRKRYPNGFEVTRSENRPPES